jgi:hypothetical protein
MNSRQLYIYSLTVPSCKTIQGSCGYGGSILMLQRRRRQTAPKRMRSARNGRRQRTRPTRSKGKSGHLARLMVGLHHAIHA